MKYYINKNKEIFGFESDGSQDGLITEDMVPITLEEIEELNKPTNEQVIKQKIQEAKAYLNSTDWYFARKAETGEEVPAEVITKRAEARKLIQDNIGGN